MKELLLTKDALTTKYQRYAGPRAVIAALWESEEVNIADFGCGANYGLRGIELGEPFEPIEDLTPNQYFSKALAIPIKIHEGLAIDKQNPEDPEVKVWSVACSYYPKELDQIDKVKEFEMRLKKSKKVMFLHADLLSLPTLETIPQKHFHVVILSTILYQQPPEAQQAIIAEAEKVTAKDGILIIQDFARKDPDYPKGLIFDEPWSFNFGYRTFIMRPNTEELLEVFQWSDGRCHTVRPGEDYWKIFT